jgi:hypothetical protein
MEVIKFVHTVQIRYYSSNIQITQPHEKFFKIVNKNIEEKECVKPHSLLEKLTSSQLLKKFPAFYGT